LSSSPAEVVVVAAEVKDGVGIAVDEAMVLLMVVMVFAVVKGV